MIDQKALRQMLSYTRRAIDDYNMIDDGDAVAVGVSGGKDSLTLLAVLSALARFYPKKFTVVPITIEMGFEGEEFSNIEALCAELGLTPHFFKSDISEIVFKIREEKRPCSLCANLRRGALHDAALSMGCRKIALGHHFDDAVETFYMNLINEGRIGCFSPVTFLTRKEVTIIRPLIYAAERDITHFVRVSEIEPSPKRCPNDGYSDREKVKSLLAEMERADPGVKTRIFGAMERGNVSGFKENPRARK